jgi:predicted O-methyltransferase YrrM
MARFSLTERLVRRVYYKYYARNLLFELQVRSRSESADYVQSKMLDAVTLNSNERLLKLCLGKMPSAGAVLEFGVANGDSIRQIAAAHSGTVYGFDSFYGLPEDWAGHGETKGAFSQGGKQPKVPKNVVLVQGMFQDTIDTWLAAHADPIGFLHIDCDLYSSTCVVLEKLAGRLRAGSVIAFDEYFNYPNWQAHEYKAWQEFVARFGVSYKYIAFTARGGSVAVQIASI